ncbi:type 1 glutamine amidotransferase [Myxococcota bacterium]
MSGCLQVLVNIEREGPGRLLPLAQALGLEVVVREVYRNQALPDIIAEGDALVVLGGPMGVSDISGGRWPFLAQTASLLRRTLDAGRPVLGICLGAQLLAHAAGARVYPLAVGDPPVRHREVGWGAVRFVQRAARELSLEGMGSAAVVLHWHGDTFVLPDGATLLASSLPCPNQMFRLGARAFGLQFHVEATEQLVTDWVEKDAEFVRLANGPHGCGRILADTQDVMGQHYVEGDRLLRNLLGAMFG